MPRPITDFRSHGSGAFDARDFQSLGRNAIFEAGCLVFHPEAIRLGDNVYVGHHAILKGYFRNEMSIGNDCWIGQGAFLHAGGGLTIGNRVGIGPHVKIITTYHREEGIHVPILYSSIEEAPVVIEDDCDLGVGCIILPGITVGRGSQVGAGAVVTSDVAPYTVCAGVPARAIRSRTS